MSIFCACNCSDECAWYYYHNDPEPVQRNRATRCISCKTKIKPGDMAAHFFRFRHPKTEIEEKIFGEGGEIPMATWFMCQDCYTIFKAFDKLDVCIDLGNDNVHDCLAEFNRDYAPKGFVLRVPGLQYEEILGL